MGEPRFEPTESVKTNRLDAKFDANELEHNSYSSGLFWVLGRK